MNGQSLQLGSGVLAVVASALLAYRVLGVPLPAPAPPPAVYAPAPVKPANLGQMSESERPANGFIVVLESEPEGALLFVDGVENGETPSSLNFECEPGKKYALRLEVKGYAPLTHEVSCKKDVMLVLNAKLKRQ